MKRIRFGNLVLVVLIIMSCSKNDTTLLEIEVNYGNTNWTKEGLIKGNLYVSGIEQPLYSDLKTDKNGKIIIADLLTGTYKFEYYIKPYGPEGDYWPIPKDTVFQFRENSIVNIKLD